MRIKSKFINRKAWQQQIQSVKESILNKWLEVDYETQPVRATLMMLAEQFGADLQLVQDNGLHDMWGMSILCMQSNHLGVRLYRVK